MEDLQGKTALVTGASTGIGAAVAIAYAARGMRVAVHYNSSADAANAVVETIRDAGGSAFALKADVRDTAAIRGAVELTIAEFGHIDVLVNNAGSLVKRVPIAEFDDALFDEVMHINARSVISFCRHVVPLMRAHGQGGSIINVSSVAARNGGPFQDRFSTPAILESFKAGIPMGRIGDPDDCVGAFLYLASSQLSGYVTGQVLEVNGGQYMP
jgi:3-oxoacyl-[acyl-carrier protein] reductase